MARCGQIFTMDLILALLIMIGALLALLVYSPAERAPFRDDLERVSVFMSEGEPAQWNNTSVRVPGFLSDSAFNETKVQAFEAMSADRQRSLLGVVSQFSVRFSQANSTMSLCATCGPSVPPNYEDLLVLQRYAVLNGTVTKMEVTLWR